MRTKGKSLAIWGLVLQVGYLIEIVGTIVGKHRAVPLLADKAAMQTEETRAALVSIVTLDLYTTAIGMTVSIVGIILLCIALFGVKYRALWFRTVMWIMAILWLVRVPIGIVLGIVVMIYLATHKNEFTEQLVAERTSDSRLFRTMNREIGNKENDR